MIGVRQHFRRTIQGTSRIEHLQVLHTPATDGSRTIVVDTWSRSGTKAVTHRREHVDGDAAALPGIAEAASAALVGEFWESRYAQELASPAANLAGQVVGVTLAADVDLLEEIHAMSELVPEIGIPLEEKGGFFIGPYQFNLTKSRRKAGENRELRYDRLAAQAFDDTLAARVLALLAMKHESTFMDGSGDPMDPATFVAELADDDRFTAIIDAYGIKVPRVRPGVYVRPWGKQFQPAVF